MNDEFTILIADRNPHVRMLLKRELSAAGYRVCLAMNGRELLDMINIDDSPDLLILDLDIPCLGGVAILEMLEDRVPTLPVIIHSFQDSYHNHSDILNKYVYVEKTGDLDHLKSTVEEVLRKSYPHRSSSKREKEHDNRNLEYNRKEFRRNRIH